MVNVQEWLNSIFPTKEEREKIIDLGVYRLNKKSSLFLFFSYANEVRDRKEFDVELEGELNLNSFINLESLYISNCPSIRILKIEGCKKLRRLNITENTGLNSIDISENKGLHILQFPPESNLIHRTIEKIQTKERELDLIIRETQYQVTKLDKELTETKQQHHNQLAEMAKIVFSSGTNHNDISFSDFKEQAKIIVKENSEKDQKIKILSKEADNLRKEKLKLERRLLEINRKNTEKEIQTRRIELENIKKLLKSKLEENFHDELDDLLDANEECVKNDNSNFAKRQFEKNKKKLIEKGNLVEQEIVNICEIQKELVKLEVEIKNRLENKIEVNI